jgi:peptidoglycan/LPS O-acetylase OafA/YrhL
MSGTTIRHLPGLDGLRGLAVVAVIAFHAGHLRGGYLGVDLFFTLSGFLITSLLLAERDRTDSIALRAFWERRFRRLLPAALVLLVAVAAYAAFWADPLELPGLRGDGLATLFYVANWRAILSNASYWANYAAPSPLHHAWSLAIEEQFYVIWPIVAVAVLRTGDAVRRHRRLLIVCVAGAISSWVWMAVLFTPDRDVSRIYYGTDTRAGAILAGAALAVVLFSLPRSSSPRVVRALDLVAGAALLALVVAWVCLDGQSPWLYQGGFALCALAALLIVTAVAVPEQPGVLARVLSVPPLRAAGLISYGLYLWHWPVFVWMTPASTGITNGGLLLALQLGVTLGVTLASYYLIEQPIRHRRWPTGRTAVAAAPVAMASVAMLLVVTTIAAPVARTGALTAEALGPGAVVVDADGLPRPARVLLVGDSVGASLAEGIDAADGLPIDVVSLAKAGCGINTEFDQIRRPDGSVVPEDQSCAEWPQRWRDTITTFQPDVRILVLGWPGQTERVVHGQWRQPCDPVFDAWYTDRVVDALTVLHEGATDTTSVAVTTAGYFRPESDPPPDNDRHVACLNDAYRRAASQVPSTQVVDLGGWVCSSPESCREHDGGPLRTDGLHFLGPAAEIAAGWVLHEALNVPSG